MAQRTTLSAFLAAAALLILLVSSASLFGQAISGDVTGTILDPTGAGVPNAKVEAVNTATGVAAQQAMRTANIVLAIFPRERTTDSECAGFAAGSLRNVCA